MIIQCPSCGARAKLPDSKEGAKVRCGECQRVYVAGLGRRGGGRSSSNNQGLWIGLGVAGLAAIVFLFVAGKGGGDDAAASTRTAATDEPEPVEDAGPRVDPYSYDGPAAKAARELHALALARNGADLRARLHGPSVYAWKARVEAEASARAAAEAEGLDREATDERVAAAVAALPSEEERMEAFSNLPTLERNELLGAWSEELYDGATKDLVADWVPYEGEATDLTSDTAVVLLRVTPAEGDSVENRTVRWGLRKQGGRWLAASWERHLTQAELDAALRARLSSRGGLRGVEKVELTDGSVVLEREPEPLPHLEDTPAELRTRIDGLLATMLDLELTREAIRARDELVAIGRPAIPPLLTKLYEIPLDTEDQSIQVNMVVVALRDITGQYFGYEPQELVGSGTGTSRERRLSSIKQWFAWWYRNEDRFTEKEVEDLLDQTEMTDEEKRYLERIGGADR